MMAKALQTAMIKATSLPEAEQEQIGLRLLSHFEQLDALRVDLQAGLDQLDAGLGRELDMEAFIDNLRREHADS